MSLSQIRPWAMGFLLRIWLNEKRNCKIKSFGTLADEVRQNLREENEYADNTCKDLPGKGKTWLLHMFEISQQEDQHGETECSNRR